MRRPTSPPFSIHPAPAFLHLPVFHPLPHRASQYRSPPCHRFSLLANRPNMRQIYPPDLEGVRSLYIIETTNRDATSRDHSDLSFWPNNGIDQLPVCVVNRFRDRNIGRATRSGMRD